MSSSSLLPRGNILYFPDRAIPMLPERLSGDLCSLRSDRDRIASVAEPVVDASAKLNRRGFYRAVIPSRVLLVYEDAARWREDPGPEGWEKRRVGQGGGAGGAVRGR